MRQSLLIFMSICFNLLIAEASIQTNYNTYNQFSFFENHFSWEQRFKNDFTVYFNTKHLLTENSYFDRSSKNTNYIYTLSFDKYFIKPFLIFDYSSFYNTGLPEDSVSVNDKYLNQLGAGYSASFLNNKLVVQQRGKHVRLDNPQRYYYGWRTDTMVSYQELFENNTIHSTLYYSNNDTFLERYDSHGVDLTYRYSNINLFSFRIRYDLYEKEIYLFNMKDDRSVRDDYNAHLNLKYSITDYFDFTIDNFTNYRRLNFVENTSRNNWVFDNNLNYQLNYYTSLGKYYSRLGMFNRTRYLKSNNQSRDSEEKKITFGALWNFVAIDTLRIEIENSILQNFHSGTYSFLDNDRVMTSYSIFVVNNFQNHNMKNIVQVFQGEQVYTNSILSANNHEKVIYQWSPEVELFLNHYFKFINKYTMRADYDYFIWHDFLKDRFYRYLSAEWGIRFFEKNHFLSQSRRNTYDFIGIYTAFILEHNETAEKYNSVWYRNSSQYLRSYVVSVIYQKDEFYIRLQPEIKYDNNTIESEVQFDSSYTVGDFTVSTSVNPIGKQFNKMIWRFNLSVQYMF